MNRFLRHLPLLSAALAAAPCLAAPEVGAQPITARVLAIDLSDFGPDSLRASVRVSASATSSAVVRELFFDEVEINGVRVHVAPIREPIRFRAGQTENDVPDFDVEMTYRELESLAPLRRAVEEGRARVHAGIRAQLELNLFQKLALRVTGAWTMMTLDEDVPVNVPGGVIGRAAASAALLAAEPVWQASQLAREWRRNQSALSERVKAEIPGRLAMLETTWRIRSRDGQLAEQRTSRLGVLIGNGQVLAPAEILEPWMFVNDLAEAVNRGDISIDEAAVNIVATPAGFGRSYSLERRELRVLKSVRGEETAIAAASKHRYRVRFRDSDSNAVLLEIPALKQSNTAATITNNGDWDDWRPAALVRVADGGQPTLWMTEARMENGRLRLKDLVDESAIGSPVWMESGVAGMVQDEGSASGLNALLAKLR
jgi:hypothetical protein